MATYPALSVLQPWAELIVLGRKTVEIRNWTTDYRGVMWIHTGKAPAPDLEASFGLGDCYHGGYIGRVTLSLIVPLTEKRYREWAARHLDTGFFRNGLYGWILSNPIRLNSPVSAPGRPGLFYPDYEVNQQLLAQFSEGDKG